ncbi:pyroglutamyl peptidase [Streptomonospora sp. S1-112]|uniref:Pyroglutamyl peptidase n=1 Tax=Streptomonospora mangrovi TaxID=2883123 RepID=A0A9X3NN01_9ACTN|nr:pyroglutamyl peptidase [Streptomonospora mangrovi]MDA0563510.1 pyroglutamyl peptidase [Streptomonospora mangrovi]
MKATASTVEESRTASAAPQAILRRSGFAAAAPLFAADLASARGVDDAEQIVAAHGRRLWTEAVRQAGAVADDRHLYWARLTLSARLRAWQPDFPLPESDRAALSDRLERASRGHDDLVFPPDDRLLRVIVTGFDPCGLDTDLRRSNPSGAAALTLHGAGFEARGRPAAVRTALFPVRWRDLSAGMVERVLGPHYSPGPGAAPADAVITVGQGETGRFELAAYYAGWRDDSADNEGVRAPGPVPLPRAEPGADPAPAWTESTLPRAAILEHAAVLDPAAGGRFPVREAAEVTEIAPGESAPRTHPGGPVAGSAARGGSCGAGFSNEVAYRNTLLRDASGRAVTAGHVLTPALEVDAADPEALSGPAFERDRADIVAQLRAIIEAALAG